MKYYSPLTFFSYLKYNKFFAFMLYTNRWETALSPWPVIFQHLHKAVLNFSSQKRVEFCVSVLRSCSKVIWP